MSPILRIASQALTAMSDQAHDTQLAITQILLRSGWEKSSLGKIVRKVKTPFQTAPKIYFLDTVGTRMFVREQGGRVTSKVELTEGMSHAEILAAAKILNNLAVKFMQGSD